MNKQELKNILLQTKPHYFGLGFIQCKINQYERIHVYHPDLMPIVNIEEEVHNHRYDFESKILMGKIKNKKYQFLENKNTPTHFLQDESCNENNKQDNSEKIYGNIILQSEQCINKDETYFMQYKEFHTFQTTKCITYLKRSDYKQEMAQVIRLLEGEIICPFSVKLSPEQCWEIINDCLQDLE